MPRFLSKPSQNPFESALQCQVKVYETRFTRRIMGNLSQVPDDITFEAAIALTQKLLDRLAQEELPETSLKETVSKLVSTRNGARGFFVAYLTDARPFADHPDPEIIEALKNQPEEVSELLVKNLAMSTAMAIAHSRNAQPDQAQQSLQVSRRSADLIVRVGGDRLTAEAQSLWQSVTDASGSYTTFLEKWGYDAEQKAAIASRLEDVLPKL
jgi:hypothetical protein